MRYSPIAGDDRPASGGFKWGSQLLKFLIKEFVIVPLAPEEEDAGANCAHKSEQT